MTIFGMIQFAKVADPDLASGYTMMQGTNCRCKTFELTGKFSDLPLINTYLKTFCQQDRSFLYGNSDKQF
jgi:hypothetical protein